MSANLPNQADPAVAAIQHTALPPTTTAQEQLVSSRQSKINRTWETGQLIVLIELATGMVIACLMLIASHETIQIALGMSVLSTAFTLVVNSYFTRTNHTKTGGVGEKDPTAVR